MSPNSAPTLPAAWMDMFAEDRQATSAHSDPTVSQRRQLDAFLQSVERRALYMLELGTRQREEALDLLQDCMLRFVRRYAQSPAADWPPLFFRVVSNALVDWQRRRSVRERVLALWPFRATQVHEEEPALPDAEDHETSRPDRVNERGDLLQAINRALSALPTRQRQTFLLREWQGLSVAEAAMALGISEGSIKTHLSRAQARLREVLHEHR